MTTKPQSTPTKATPLCPVHRRLEDADALECEIGNGCVACSLNERRELLALIAPFAAEGNTEDSVTVLSRVVEFYKAHVGDNRVVVSYPAPAAASEVAPQQSEPQYLTINGQRRMVIPCPDGIPGCEVLHTAPAAIAPSPVQGIVPAEGENRPCLLCGHYAVAPDGTCMAPVPICSDDYHGTRRCACKCSFKTAPAPSAAIQDERCKCGLDKDNPIHSFSTEWQPMHKFTPKSTALNLSSLARKAAEEIFEFGKYDLEPERAKDQIAAIIERCLSEGEA